ncbi:MAG: prepilin-type N-terminal cleavage/methylation domain-containing protein [Minisyncoccia bacterium]|jgi:prepilin-type N-terminal cleavage/methylation domain-containing protein
MKTLRAGFTLIELLVTVALFVALIALLSTANLFGSRNKADLNGATEDIAALLREAQSDSMAQEQGVSWGVHLENATATTPFYALFASSTYAKSAIVGYYPLPSSVAYVTATLASGAAINITFSQVTGAASVATSVGLYSRGTASLSSTISVASSGAVSY